MSDDGEALTSISHPVPSGFKRAAPWEEMRPEECHTIMAVLGRHGVHARKSNPYGPLSVKWRGVWCEPSARLLRRYVRMLEGRAVRQSEHDRSGLADAWKELCP